jgi:hypothetical protein
LECLHHFSADYQEARNKFVSACGEVEADLSSWQNPKSGPDGRSLYTDIAVLGPERARSALVLQSGTHGVEGFAGSAIQTALLHDALLSQLASKLRLILIHAINPWGFAHLRRTNEDNVDLNRNFVDHTQPYPDNLQYQQLAHILAPTKLSSLSRTTSVVRLLSYGATHGMGALRSAASGGQYSHPEGLFYGGHFDVWSNKILRQALERHVAGARQVAFVDFHTGLGRSGHGELILSDAKDSPPHRRALDWWGKRVKTTKANESVSVDLVGTLKLAVTKSLPNAEVTAGSLEFGTLPSKSVLWALIAENWLYHHGDPNDSRSALIKDEMRRAFYTETDEWKAAVWEQGREVISQALTGMTAATVNV